MKIAITGGTGFIGRHVLAELQGHPVEIVVASRRASALPALRGVHRIVELDIGRPSGDQLDAIAACDVLIHLAWEGLPNYDSRHHFATELPRHYGFLAALVERGLPALLVAGTCLEYGQQSGELSEDRPARPTTAYGFAKDSLRRQLEFLRRDVPFAMTWARLFYCYGDGQPAGSLYPQFRAAVSRGDERFDMSGGEQLRDYLPVSEVSRLLVALAMTRADAGLLNLCSGKPVSVRRLVEGWIEKGDARIRLNLGRYPYPDHEPLAFWGARGKLDRLLGQP